jgi:hypothetical protein
MTLRIFCCLVLFSALQPAFAQSAGANIEARASPIFLELHTGNPYPGNNAGLIGEALIALGEQANKPYLQQLMTRTAAADPRQRFQALGCVFVSDPKAGCQPVELVPAAHGVSDEVRLLRALNARGVNRAWVVRATEQFFKAGYSLGLGATEYSVQGGVLTPGRTISAMYMHFYSAPADAVSRGFPHDARGAEPAFGSKQARFDFWFGGSPPQIETLLGTSPAGATRLLRKLVELAENAPDAAGWLADLPKFSELDRQGRAACRSSYCSLRVFAEEDDRIYTVGDIGKYSFAVSINRWGFD